MSQSNLHIIQRQFIDLHVSPRLNWPAVQQRLEHMLEEALLPRLEPVFDRLAGPEEWVEIDRLEVNLGRLSPEAPAEEWLEKARQTYIEALQVAVQKAAGRHPEGTASSNLQILNFFLSRGYLPWWVEQFDLEEAVKKELPENARRMVKLLDSPYKRRRWAAQAGDELQLTLLKALGSTPPFAVEQWRALFKAPERTKARLQFWESVWEAQPVQKTDWAARFLQHLFPFLPDEKTFPAGSAEYLKDALEALRATALKVAAVIPLEQWQALLSMLSKAEVQLLYRQTITTLSQRPEQEILRLLASKAVEKLQTAKGIETFRANVRKAALPEGLRDRLLQAIKVAVTANEAGEKSPQPAVEKAPAGEEAIYVPLAGIVLLHPFLPVFFEQAGLLEEEQFRDAEAQERAVHLLYFLATGREHPQETELVLLKLLCGMDIGQDIARFLDLSDREKKEATKALEAVIRQWEVLEGTTPDELRGTFFLREGKLSRGDLGWNLTVEQKGYDIVLNRLPWRLSPIMHSWMEEMVWVEWA